jgi:hypothetical protein
MNSELERLRALAAVITAAEAALDTAYRTLQGQGHHLHPGGHHRSAGSPGIHR